MRKNRTKTYWLLMATAVCVALSGALLISESYASVRSEAIWQTGLQTASVAVRSDYLAEDGQTVLLDSLTAERTVSFMLTTNGQSQIGSVNWTVIPENALNVQAPATATATAEGTQVDMTLTPGTVAQDTQVTVSVCWSAESGEQLQGDFIMLIPAEGSAEQQTPAEQAELDASMAVMEEFVADSAIMIALSHPSDTQQLLLSMAGQVFPAGTRYTTEYGQKETVLYDPAKISLSTGTAKQTVVLLKLPQSIQSQEITLQADIASESGAISLQKTATRMAGSLGLPESYFYELHGDDAFTLAMPAGWGGCTLSYTVQKLTETKTGIQYETVANSGSQRLSVAGNANEITVSLAGTTMQAGTYRLQLVWNYQTYTVADQQVTFHISYPERSTVATAGGNEP